MSTSREVDNETMAGVNSRFAEVTWNDILQMQDKAIPNNTKKATKTGMKVLKGKQYFNTQFTTCPVPSALEAFLNPVRQAPLMHASLLEEQPPFHGSTSNSHPTKLKLH